MTETTAIFLQDKSPVWTPHRKVRNVKRDVGKTNYMLKDQSNLNPEMFEKIGRYDTENPYSHDVIEKVKRDFRYLTFLAHTGVTPVPIMLKTNPEGTEARLLMTRVPGTTFEEQLEPNEDYKKRLGDIVRNVLRAVSVVNSAGVYIVDINDSSFIIDGIGKHGVPLKTHVVDCEYACDAEELANPSTWNRVVGYYATHDMLAARLQISQPQTDQIPHIMSALEIQRVLITILEFYLGSKYSSSWFVPAEQLSTTEKEEYRAQYAELLPFVTEHIDRTLRDKYRRTYFESSMVSEDEYVRMNIGEKLRAMMNEAMINITFISLLRKRGIFPSEDDAILIKNALSHNIQDRLEAINNLLNTE